MTGPLATVSERLLEAHRRFFTRHEAAGGASCGKGIGAAVSDPHEDVLDAHHDGCMRQRADGRKHNNAQQGVAGKEVRRSDGLGTHLEMTPCRLLCMWCSLTALAEQCLVCYE